MEFDILLERIQSHFTPSEFVEFLGVPWETLINNSKLQDIIEENLDDIREEIGME